MSNSKPRAKSKPDGPPYTMSNIQKWAREETGYTSGDKAEMADECAEIATGWWVMNGWRGKDRDKKKLAKSCKKYVKEEYRNRRKNDGNYGFVWVLPFVMQILLSTLISAVVNKLVDWWFSDSFEGDYLPVVHDDKYRYNRRHLVYAWADHRIATAPDEAIAKLFRHATSTRGDEGGDLWKETLAELEKRLPPNGDKK